MKRRAGLLILFLLVTSLLSCTAEDVIKKAIPDDIEQYSMEFIQTMRSGDLSEALLQLDPEMVNESTSSDLQIVACLTFFV